MKKILAMLLAVCMLFALCACGKTAAQPEAPKAEASGEKTEPATITNDAVTNKEVDETKEYKTEVHIGHHQAPVSVGPQDLMSGMQKIYENFVFNELIEYTDEEGLTPELATEWAASEGGKVWTFKLRDDVTFHNGEHFTSDDVLFTFERAVEKGVATATWVNQIEAVECPDDYTVVFTLIAPNMDFDFLCSSKYTGILNREACEADPDKGYAIGTSGFMLDEFEANDHFTVVRFDDSWVWAEKGLTPTEKVVISYYTDNNAKAIAVQAGDIDIAAVINANEAPTLDALDNITVVVPPSYSIDYVGMNAECEYFKDENVRKAVACAIDKEEALLMICNGFGETIESYWCTGNKFYTEDFDEDYSFNIDAAKAYLAQSAYPNGFECKLTTINAYSLYAETIQAQLAKIGIVCNVDLTDSPGMASNNTDGTFEMFIWNKTASAYPDNFRNSYHSGSNANYARYSNERVDELMDQGVQESDSAKREAMYKEAQKLVHDDCYYVPLFNGYIASAINSNVSGCDFCSTAYNFLYVVCEK